MHQQARADNLKKQIEGSFSCVCPVIENEFCHNIVNVSLLIHSTISSLIHSYFDNVMMKFMITNRPEALNYFNSACVMLAKDYPNILVI